MMINVLFHTFLKMSLQSIVIIAIILLVRWYLKKLDISHKYIVGLWAIVFFYLIFPWKISVPTGFWLQSNYQVIENELPYQDSMVGQNVGTTENVSNSEVVFEQDNSTNNEAQDGVTNVELNDDKLYTFVLEIVFPYTWLLVILGLSVRIVLTYFKTKKKLMLSIPYSENIYWTEEISTPMVYGLINPKIYLPICMKDEDLTYVLAHEKEHIRRKDYFTKMLAYVICLFHWFNPLVWVAYTLLGNDMEKACDEKVIQSMEGEQKKKYAYAIVHFCEKEHVKKKNVFVAPLGFDEGCVADRVKNVLHFKRTWPVIGIIMMVLSLGLAGMFMTETMQKDIVDTDGSQDTQLDENVSELPTFYVENIKSLQIDDTFLLENYYITSKCTYASRFYIDESGVLWKSNMADVEETSVKIAENVISVDASWNDYFCIYLTESGDLYEIETMEEPTLLMTGVTYARAGMKSIVVLKEDKSAYCWGQYDAISNRMMISEPLKILDNCRYITTGDYTVAAINEDNELYTFGYNAYGECGTKVTKDVFVRTPVKVCDDVKMVWVDKICFNDLPKNIIGRELYYSHNTFVLTNANSLLATGKGLGNKEQITSNGESGNTEIVLYSDSFVQIKVVEYSASPNMN